MGENIWKKHWTVSNMNKTSANGEKHSGRRKTKRSAHNIDAARASVERAPKESLRHKLYINHHFWMLKPTFIEWNKDFFKKSNFNVFLFLILKYEICWFWRKSICLQKWSEVLEFLRYRCHSFCNQNAIKCSN